MAERKRQAIAQQKREEAQKRQERKDTASGCGCLLVIIALICLVIWGPEWLSGNSVGAILGKVRGWSWIVILWGWAIICGIGKFLWNHLFLTIVGLFVLGWIGKKM